MTNCITRNYHAHGGSEWVIGGKPVSYTHLDVYKRQDEVRAGHIIVIEGIALHVNIPPACSQLV